jgi:arylsulfatase A-like enzyme
MTSQPNILCFVTDQQRADHLGCAGNPDLKTPFLDSLAEEGLVFQNSYVSNPVCSPNRACLFTGQFPKAHGLRANGNALPGSAITLPGVLRENGYQTFSSGKLHLAPFGALPEHEVPDAWKAESKVLWNEGKGALPMPYHGLEKVFYVGGHGHYNFGHHRRALEESVSNGYLRSHANPDSGLEEEVWCSDVPEERHYNTEIADRMIEFIDQRNPGRPFFGWCSFPDPHHPFSPPEPWYSMYKGADLTVNPAPDEGDEGLPELLKAFKERMRVPEGCLPECIAKNYGMISMVDHQIGRVVEHLKSRGLFENTIIVFLSDHGDYMGDHGLIRKALMPYDGLYRVPTIWRVPEAETAKGYTNALHSSVDLMPTLLDLVDINIPERVQGVSQAPVLRAQLNEVRHHVYAEYDESPPHHRIRFLRDHRYSFAYFSGLDFGMLFDMDADPQQQENLFTSPSHRNTVSHFYELLATSSIEFDSWLPAKISHA